MGILGGEGKGGWKGDGRVKAAKLLIDLHDCSAKVSQSWPTTVKYGPFPRYPSSLGPSECGSSLARFRLDSPSMFGTSGWNISLYFFLVSRTSSSVTPPGRVCELKSGASGFGHMDCWSEFAIMLSRNRRPDTVPG